MVKKARTRKLAAPDDQARWSLLWTPGIGLKRWLAVLLCGVLLIVLGLGILIHQVASHASVALLTYVATLQFLPNWARILVFVGAGVALMALGSKRINEIFFTHLWSDLQLPENREVVNTILRRYRRSRGPHIVVIGGGTGMPLLLRGLRRYTDNITAIVTVADDGGSSGRLRQTLGMLPPGDFRNNIDALSEAEGLMTRLFQYRFAASQVGDPDQRSELAGHSFGNLFITTMAAVTGSFEAGIAESSKVLRVRGRVLPSTLEDVTLCAEVCRPRADGGEEWVVVEGESLVPKSGGRVQRVYLKPELPRAYPEAIRAILQADLIVAGPGSFFTSVIPNLLVPGVRDAICAAAAPRIYVCNVATQPGETDGFSVLDHMRKLRDHAGDAFTTVIANSNYTLDARPSTQSQWVALPPPGASYDFRLIAADVVDVQRPFRHDPDKLAACVMEAYQTLCASAGKN